MERIDFERVSVPSNHRVVAELLPIVDVMCHPYPAFHSGPPPIGQFCRRSAGAEQPAQCGIMRPSEARREYV